MKRRLFTGVLGVMLLIVATVFGFGCFDKESPSTITLSESVKEVVIGESFTLTATVEPEGSIVSWSSSNESVATVSDGRVQTVGVGSATITVKNGDASAKCEVTVKDVQKFAVTFKNQAEVLFEANLAIGSTVSYSGAIPSKTATSEFSYEFIGWALEEGGEIVDLATVTVDKNLTFFAVFQETVRSYDVIWNIEGETQEFVLKYGETPEYKGEIPTKEADGTTNFTFVGWATSLTGDVVSEFAPITGEVTYYAIFEEVTEEMTFEVVWMNESVELKTDSGLAFGVSPEYVGEAPEKEPTESITYVFAGWSIYPDGEILETLPLVTTNLTLYAQFEETARIYTISWIIEGVEHTSNNAYGTVPAYEGRVEKADSAACTYVHDGWALSKDGEKLSELPTVSGEATYYAVFVPGYEFPAEKYLDRVIEYSSRTEEAFVSADLFGEETLASAYLFANGAYDTAVYENGEWKNHELLKLTDEELKANAIGVRRLYIVLSDGSKHMIDMHVYAGIINELADFKALFDNTAVASEFDAVTYPAVAPNVYGYYIVADDLGSLTDELKLNQTRETDYQKTNGFNGILDGRGHTLRFKLVSGGLVGLVLGNATIKNLAVIYEDASFISQDEGGGYGVFGYVTNGAPVIDNCYIERINTVNSRSSVLGIMARPNGRLVLKNTVVYGYNVQNNCSWWGEEVNCISKDSVNAYAIHNRANTATQTMLRNFTKVFDDGIWEGSREVLLSEIADARGFNDAYWHKENGKLIWKGIEIATINWVTEEETITEVVTKGGYFVPQGLPESSESATEIITYHWATSQNGSAVGMGTSIQGVDDATYYLVKNVTKKTVKITWVINGEESYTEHELGEALNPEAPTVESDIYVYEFLGWSLSEDGDIVEIGEVTEAKTYYAVFDKQLKGETEVSAIADILYSSHDDQLFLPAGIYFTISTVTAITSGDGATVYYQDGAWVRNFDLSAEQIRSNSIGTTEVLITTNDNVKYSANVKSYAGVIDELADFPRFFNNTAVPSEFDATKTAVA
ncbi:MAG: InlB B-repeat-containing protein, partial [Clostridia bacterium]|nr:InlB B-repeat-containing protein [Clostridia bacterium]